MAEAPLSAEEIVHRGFPSTFRGFDPAEVRAYLVRVASELKAAGARERELKQKLTEAEQRANNPVIDQDMLMKALGEETSRVLASAQEAARQLKARAEEAVAKILREAHEQAQQIRATAEVVLADRTEEADAAAAEIRGLAQAEATALVEQTRREAEAARAEVVDQARQLVQEAQAARARVLGDLARRRRVAHTQVEQLRAGRERLLDAYRVVRRTLDEVADELERAEPEARTAAAVAAGRLEAALESAGALPGEDADEGGASPPLDAGLADGAVGVPAPTGEAAVPAPAPAPTGASIGPPGETQPVSVSGAEPALSETQNTAAPPAAAPRAGSKLSPPIVAREERVEERKLSSLRILRRPKPDAAPETEAKAAPSQVEGVRVIPAAAEPGPSAPPPPPPPRADREPPSVVPGVTWAPARSDAPPPPPPPGPRSPAPTAPPPAAEDPATSPSSPSPVEELFARIRAYRAVAPTTEAEPAVAAPPEGRDESLVSSSSETGPVGGPEVASSPNGTGKPALPDVAQDQGEPSLQRRDEAIEAIEAALTRKLKRALQDEHNDVLDRLRSCKGPLSVAAVLPPPADQQARYATAAGELLAEAARSGVRFVSTDQTEPTSPEVADLVDDLTEALVGPLRRGVERGAESAQEDASVLADTIGAAYRECKSQRLERLAGDAAIAAFSRGTLSVSGGTDLRWVVDDGDVACPDCDDNALAGPTPSGEPYPTGQSHPPAHAGCRCLLVPERP